MLNQKIVWIFWGIVILILFEAIVYFLIEPQKRMIIHENQSPIPTIINLTPIYSPSSVPSPSTLRPTLSFSEDNYIFLKKSPALSSFLLTLVYEGVLEKKIQDEWTIRNENETLIFKVGSETKFISNKKLISPEYIELGSKLQITVALIARKGYNQEIEKGDLRNQNTQTVILLTTGLKK